MRKRKAWLALVWALLLLTSACQNREGGTVLVVHPKEKELTLGTPFSAATQLSVESRPSETEVELKWSTSNEKVAVVDERGFVTAVSYGTAKVTVQDEISGAKSTCKLKIRTVPQNLEIRTHSAELRVGQTLNLSPKLAPLPYIPDIHKTITWSSSKTAVATVDARGRVTAVGPGTAEITGETVNGLKEVCRVAVKE